MDEKARCVAIAVAAETWNEALGTTHRIRSSTFTKQVHKFT
jgi:hypothetical protein